MLLLVAFAGAVHMLSPDHWMPFSLLSWQRGWRAPRILFLSLILTTIHAALAFAIYRALSFVFDQVTSDNLIIFSAVMIAIMTFVRTLRFGKIGDSFGSSTSGNLYGFLSILSLLGPSEALIPILMKSKMVGFPVLDASLGFVAGSFIGMAVLAYGSRFFWLGKPYRLPRLMEVTQRRVVLAPLTVGLAAGIVLVLSFR